MSDFLVDGGLIFAYILTGIAALGFIGSELFYIATNFSDSKNTVLGIGVLLVILVIGFVLGGALSPDQATIDATSKVAIDESTMAKVNGGLVTTYILLALASIALIGDLVMGLIRK